jgi:hypothetical protein
MCLRAGTRAVYISFLLSVFVIDRFLRGGAAIFDFCSIFKLIHIFLNWRL